MKKIKVGDLVKLRDDLVDGKYYGESLYCKDMTYSGFREVKKAYINMFTVYNEEKFQDYYYTPEMIAEVKRPVKYETIYKYKKPILDDVEKEYLRGVIRPFRNEIKYICKESNDLDRKEFIAFSYKGDYDYTTLKQFKAGTMYKNMVAGKDYTLEELGL